MSFQMWIEGEEFFTLDIVYMNLFMNRELYFIALLALM